MSRNQIHIVTPQLPLKRGFNDFYPLIKWQKAFANQGLYFKYFNSHVEKKIFDCSILILDYRYYQQLINKKVYPDKGFILDFIIEAKKKGLKVVLFDSGDGTGSRCFSITPYVDIHLKKQVLKDLSHYTHEFGNKSSMCWVPRDLIAEGFTYDNCREADLKKIRVSWNIGMVDHRVFPFSSFYPTGTSALLNSMYRLPVIHAPSQGRKLLTSYRGSIKTDARYSYQRRPLLETLDAMKSSYPVSTGGNLKKKDYVKEMRNSKAVVSPFGWGEVCYRDFECFLNGSLLVKPNMEHLSTFPDFFVPGETYVPVKWDLSDLEKRLIDIHENYEYYLRIAVQGQNKIKNAILDEQAFLSHFEKIVLE